jgi:hypothetical protein
MRDYEIALQAAINALRDTIESNRMPGLPLEPDAAELHELALRRLKVLLRRTAGGPRS